MTWNELRTLWREDYATHGDWKLCGFKAMFVYRFGVYCGLLKQGLPRRVLLIVYMMLFRWIRNHYGIELLRTTFVGRRVKLAHQHGICIHVNSTIGDDCVISHGVTLGGTASDNFVTGPTLERDVFVSPGAMLIGDITIGKGAQIAPNAVVMQDVPSGFVAIGNPARLMPLPEQALDEKQDA